MYGRYVGSTDRQIASLLAEKTHSCYCQEQNWKQKLKAKQKQHKIMIYQLNIIQQK